MSDKAEGRVHKESSTILNFSVKPGTHNQSIAGGSHSGSNGSTNNKPDIKVSVDGVAKLNFSFLEETGDSSLEPGEVVTPPQSSSPVSSVTKVLPVSSLAATNSSQREAQVCKEKVSAILEIDAQKRKEENEKRKQDIEKLRQSGELESFEDKKRKEKAERKRIKRVEKEQRAARLALMSDDNEEHRETNAEASSPTKVKSKTKRITEDRESYESGERVSSSGEEGESGRNRPRQSEVDIQSVVNTAASTSSFHPTTTVSHLNTIPDGYCNGPMFRPMFPRHMRPDFHHPRGVGYMIRGRGRNMRHPLYRAPFFGNGPKGHGPYHALPRQPHPSRGHSPIMAPSAEVRWTQTQPSISFSYRSRHDSKYAPKLFKIAEPTKPIESENALRAQEESEETKRRASKKAQKKTQKKHKRKTKKGLKSKEKEKEKRNTRFENCDKANLRKIVKIRNSFEKGKSKSKLDKIGGGDLEKKLQASNDGKEVPLMRRSSIDGVNESYHIEKHRDSDTTPDYEPPSAKPELENINKADEKNAGKSNDLYDIFAESPPRTKNSYLDANIKKVRPSPIKQLSSASSQSHAEKPRLQKAIEMQQRIGKLLQDDDLQTEKLEATKEKLLQKTQNLVYGPLPPPPKLTTTSTSAPHSQNEQHKKDFPKINEKNAYRSSDSAANKDSNTQIKRSENEDWKVERRHSSNLVHRVREKVVDESNPLKGFDRSAQRTQSKHREPTANRSSSKRKYSRSPPSERPNSSLSREHKVSKFEENLKGTKTRKLKSSPKTSKTTGIVKSSIETTRLSFNASEFLFPDDEDSLSPRGDEKQNKQSSTEAAGSIHKVNVDDETSESLSVQNKRFHAISSNKVSNSPDTDDYMDNWELDDPDSPNNTVETNIEIKSFKPDRGLAGEIQKSESRLEKTATKATSDQTAMQEIYNEFIKSVEAAGVDVNDTVQTPTIAVKIEPLLPGNEAVKGQMPAKRAVKRNLSTSSNSSSSSSTSSSSSGTSSSESSEYSTSGESSSSSSTVGVAIKQEKENDQVEQTDAMCSSAISPAAKLNLQHQTNQPESTKSNSAEHEEQIDESNPTKDANANTSRLDPVEVLKSVLPSAPNEQQKQQIAKDLKRVKSYDANLRRTQLMRSNFDQTDDIFGELAKMEKLFKHAINFIIQKYTKDRQLLLQTDVDNLFKPLETLTHTNPQEVTVEPQATHAEAATAEPEVINKIFDSNRETIKLTIAPLKLTKAPAIFEKLDKPAPPQSAIANAPGHGALDLAADDTDFTETLVKTTKEVAIVKPMSKSGRSPSPRPSSGRSNKKSSPRSGRSHGSSSRRSNSRSGSVLRSSEQRSTSRIRQSSGPRRNRTPTMSVSPVRRGCHIRQEGSPKRRARNTSPIGRFRDRCRSPMRRSTGRRDSSPMHRRRRQLQNIGGRHYDVRSYSRSQSRSRSRSPGLGAHYRQGGRPHSPRNSSPAGARRSYSRDRYSRSPLPFKPPSPPEQETDSKRSRSRSRHSRSFSHSPSPISSLRRSRSRSRSPRSPNSPRSTRLSRPHTPPMQYDREGSYDMYRRSHSPSQQHGYFDPVLDSHTPIETSAYYYAVPSNMLHNVPDAEQRSVPIYGSYNDTNYDQYQSVITSAYLPQGLPLPHSHIGTLGNEYYGEHFSAAPSGSLDPNVYGHHQHQQHQQQPLPHQQNMHVAPPRPNNFCYNQQVQGQHTRFAGSPFFSLKELRKEGTTEGTFAVQKGNVLEIVPSELALSTAINEPSAKTVTTVAATEPIEQFATRKPPKPVDPIKEEITLRLQESAKLKKERKSVGEVPVKSCILKKQGAVETTTEPLESEPTETKEVECKPSTLKPRKKVLFEDGLFPNRDSEDEDKQDAEKKLRIELRRLRKKGRKAVTVIYLLSNRKPGAKHKPTVSDLAKLPPPPPPAMAPPRNLEQPVPNRPLTPPHFMFYHYDPLVQALYTSPSERGIPPRLTDPKAAAIFSAAKVLGTGVVIKPRSSPVFSVKRDHVGGPAVAAMKIGASITSNNRCSPSPQLPQSPFYGVRRGVNLSFNKHQPPPPSPSPQAFSQTMHQQLRFALSSPGSPISTLTTQPLTHAKVASKTIPAVTTTTTGTFQAMTSNSPLTPPHGPAAVLTGLPPRQLQQSNVQTVQSQVTSPPIGFAIGSLQQHPRAVHPAMYQNIPPSMSAVNGSGATVRPPTAATQQSFAYNNYGLNFVQPESVASKQNQNKNFTHVPPPSIQNLDAMS